MTVLFKNEQEVYEWIESVDEQYTQAADVQDELAAAWLIVFGNELLSEEEDMRRDAWSHLCSAVR